MTDDRLDPELLDAFEVPAPSADLGDRFSARLRARPARRDLRVVALGGVVLAAAAAVFVVLLARSAPGATDGTAAPRERTTARLGRRGVAVAEAGSRLAWHVGASGVAHVDQARGSVFYRVEPGGVFGVSTPAGEVSVHGTCFRIELEPAGTAIVTVYEGVVELANAHGQVELAAGDRAEATAGAMPRLAPTAVALAAPAADVSMAELVARDRALRDRVAALEARLAGVGPTAAMGVVNQQQTRPFEMSQAELGELARKCLVPFDVPPTAGSTMMDKLIDDGFRTADFTEDDKAAVRRVVGRFQSAYQTQLQGFYRELTGDDGAALDPLTLVVEILQKSTPGEISAAYEQLAAERAGLRTPSAAASATAGVFERYLRFALGATDDFERQLATEIGAARARVFRRTWGMVNLEPGCPAKEGER